MIYKTTVNLLLLFLSLLIAGFTNVIHAQSEQTVSGTVTSADDNGVLPGVNVSLKGTSQGAITNENGNYALEVTSLQDTLIFSYIGYDTQIIPINGRTTINVEMVPGVIGGAELVVVGYGIQEQQDVTGSISSVSEQELQDIPVANTTEALQGRVAGVRIQRTSTRPGQTGQIRIRGTRSLSASNDPLIVVDNIPFQGSINDLNTNNIQSIEVLKDASATAIYGSRGANGVLLITTKGGQSGEEPQITYNGLQGINTVAREYPVFSGPEFVDMRNLSGWQPYTAREQENLAAEDYTDWQDLMYEDGITADHQLTVSGGSENSQYSLGGGYYKETAVTPGQQFERYALNASINQDIGDRITVGLKSNSSYSVTDGESAGFMYPILTTTPLSPAYNEDGTYVLNPAGPTEGQYSPLLLNNEDIWEEQRKRISTFNSLFGELQIIDQLRYRINVGVSYRQDEYGNFYGSDTPFNNGGTNTAQVNNGNAYDYTIENLLYYNDTFAEKHNLKFTGLFSVFQSIDNNTDVRATNLVADYIQYYNLGLSNDTPTTPSGNQGYGKRGLLSYMGRINYNYDDRYLLTLTGRADGSSVLAEGNKWHYYPAVALAWNITNESFMDDVDFLNNLKLRLSYGQTSNQAVAPYTTLGSLDQNLYNFGSNNAYGYYVSTLPNQGLDWEYTESYNIGLDFGFLRNRITGSFEAYKQHTSNLLLNEALPATSGVPGAFLNNVGETENKGLEFQISTINIESQGDGFRWTTDANIFLNRNKIVGLSSGVQQNIGNGWFVGEPINVAYDYEKLGIWQLNEAQEAAQYDLEPGQIKVADLNGDGSIDEANDRRILGSLNPDFEFGITNRFNYKGIDLSIVAFGRIGGTLISTLHQPTSYLNMLSGRRNGIKVNYWTPSNPTDDFPMPNASRGDNPTYGSALGYYDASFFKVRNITLGYSLPAEWVNSLGGQSIRVYGNVRNVVTLFSPYLDKTGISPQPTGSGSQGVNQTLPGRQLTIGSNTPPVRSFSLGVDITF